MFPIENPNYSQKQPQSYSKFLNFSWKLRINPRNLSELITFATKFKQIMIMILTTTPQIEGHTIREYKGVVTGETIIGANFVKDFFASIRDIVGGRSGSYEKVLREAKDTSMKEMMERAQIMGANAIVGIDIDYETIGETNSMLMVATSGTAVVI
jgi:uncharacterized protein YbjQ (UPF0145 family)